MLRRPLFGLLVIGVLALAPAPVAAQSAWSLVDSHQSACYYPPQGWTNYYAVWLKGSWSRPISVSISGAPAGATTWTYESPIPPGRSDGSGSLAYVAVKIPDSTPMGSYTPRLTASDGASTQSVAVGLTVQSNCSSY